MPKPNKKPCRLLHFIAPVAAAALLTAAFLNITYSLQDSSNVRNVFLGATTAQPTTSMPPPATRPATSLPTAMTMRPPPVTANPPPITRPTPSMPPTATQPPTEPTIKPPEPEPTLSTISIMKPPEPTTAEDYEIPGDNTVPGGNLELTDDTTDTTNPVNTNTTAGSDDITVETVDDNRTPGGNINLPNPPQTGDEESDPRIWLAILITSSLILRYLLFLIKKPEK